MTCLCIESPRRTSIFKAIAATLIACVATYSIPRAAAAQSSAVRHVSPNGFEMTASSSEILEGVFLEFRSAWGETMTVAVKPVQRALDGLPWFHFIIDDQIEFDLLGSASGIELGTFVGSQYRLAPAERTADQLYSAMLRGASRSEARAAFESSLEGSIAHEIRQLHSDEFIQGLAEAELIFTGQASCLTATLGCLASVAGVILSFAAVVAACVISTGPAFMACVLALTSLGLGKVAAVFDCVDAKNECKPPPPPPLPCTSWDCETPLLIDLDRNGFHLSAGPVVFDLDGDGGWDVLSWTKRGQQDAFIVYDRNGNGLVDNGTELFGGNTKLSDGSLAENGYEALAEFDSPALGGNGDSKISRKDSVYPRLSVWTDLNSNGVTDDGEMKSLRKARVLSIDLDYQDGRHRDKFGNEIRFVSQALVGRRGRAKRTLTADVFFRLYSGTTPSSPSQTYTGDEV